MSGARVACLAAAVAVLACEASPPPPSRVRSASDAGTPSSQATEPSRITQEPGDRTPIGELGRQLTMGALDPAFTEPLLEFASDGESVIFSSGVADGANALAAPDLWRYRPGDEAPELLWSNPARDRSLIRVGGERGTWAFVDAPTSGELAWSLYVLTEGTTEPVLLDAHPGDERVSGLAPTYFVQRGQIAWTAFDLGASGPVSQLLYARAPDWRPILLAERDARRAELWMPTLRGRDLVYSEVVYSPDRSTDERRVYRMSVARPDDPHRRLDTSGRATMPLILTTGGIVWKEAEPGFSMFNWGRMFRYDEAAGTVTPLSTRPQEFVNFPSAGRRFVAWWGVADRAFGVYDLDLGATRLIDRWPAATNVHVIRPHVSGDLLVWMQAAVAGPADDAPARIWFAMLPGPRSDGDR